MKKAGGSKLFDSSEDEDDDPEEERFKIKPQFEGRAGQKVPFEHFDYHSDGFDLCSAV